MRELCGVRMIAKSRETETHTVYFVSETTSLALISESREYVLNHTFSYSMRPSSLFQMQGITKP